MFVLRLAGNLVVHQCADVVLEHCVQLFNNGLVRTFLNLLFKEIVDLENLLVAEGQVIFRTHCATHLD